MSKFVDALRKRYASPEAALRALGLSPDLINPPRMAQDSLFACDEDLQAFKRYWGDCARNWKPSNVTGTVAPGKPTQNGFVESFNGRMRDELLNESLFFGIVHAHEAIRTWAADYNTARPHSSLAYRTPADYAAHLTAIDRRAALLDGSALRPIAQPTPKGVLTAEALIPPG